MFGISMQGTIEAMIEGHKGEGVYSIEDSQVEQTVPGPGLSVQGTRCTTLSFLRRKGSQNFSGEPAVVVWGPGGHPVERI